MSAQVTRRTFTTGMKKLLDFFKKRKYNIKMKVGDLVKITDNQDGLNEELAVVIQTLPSTGEVVIHHIRDNTPWIYYVDQLTLLSEVRK